MKCCGRKYVEVGVVVQRKVKDKWKKPICCGGY
jgi:hypothetical protein